MFFPVISLNSIPSYRPVSDFLPNHLWSPPCQTQPVITSAQESYTSIQLIFAMSKHTNLTSKGKGKRSIHMTKTETLVRSASPKPGFHAYNSSRTNKDRYEHPRYQTASHKHMQTCPPRFALSFKIPHLLVTSNGRWELFEDCCLLPVVRGKAAADQRLSHCAAACMLGVFLTSHYMEPRH